MTNFPTNLDTDIEIPSVDNNLSEIGADVINACRSAIFAIEQYIGLTGNGTLADISSRIDVSIDVDGTIRPAAVTALGLVTLPITNVQVSATAAIDESKLALNFTTTDLNNFIDLLKLRVLALENFYNNTGYKLADHLTGANYRHNLTAIDVDLAVPILNHLGVLRNTTNATQLIKDLNDDFIVHQTNTGNLLNSVVLPVQYSHTAGAVYIDSARFNSIPLAIDDLQKFTEFMDSNSLLHIGARLQNLFDNGISRASRSSIFELDGYGQNVVPVTPVITYLLNGSGAQPVDDIYIGDNVIKFVPSPGDLASNLFDSYFSKVKAGDIIRIDYGGVEVKYLIDSIKLRYVGLNKEFYVRINGKNILDSTVGFARIDRPNYHDRKQGILSVAQANNELGLPSSLIVSHPRAASALGNGINLSILDSDHYNLYLQLYPDGNPESMTINLPAIDVTGNLGATQGLYSIDTVVFNTNEALRQYGYNLRFAAFQYAGEFGIMLSEPYSGAGFSIIAGEVDTNGDYGITSNASYPQNVIDTYNLKDAFGLGRGFANVAGPPYANTFSTSEMAIVSTKVHVPLTRNFFYLNGYELDLFPKDVLQFTDANGDGYWDGYVQAKSILADRVRTTYEILLNLSDSKLAKGKTITVLPTSTLLLSDPGYNPFDYGRFTIESVDFDICNCDGYLTTRITVTDAVHASGVSPSTVSNVGTNVKLYFTEDSVGFDYGHVSDGASLAIYKRLFETYITEAATTFNHERARFDASISTNVFDFVDVSPKLRGYASGLSTKIWLKSSYDSTTETFTGYLYKDVSTDEFNLGLVASGKKGEVIRFYDESGIDFIDFKTDVSSSISTYTNNRMEIELFPSIQYDAEVMLLGVCQYNDITESVTSVKDKRQFGNISEKQLTTSALDFISAGEKYLHENGVVRGLDLVESNYHTAKSISNNFFYMKGGVALVNGKFINLNESKVTVPQYQLRHTNSSSVTTTYTNINWLVCINDKGELVSIVLADKGTGKYELYNPLTTTGYEVSAVSFNDLILLRKDLTALYLVAFTINGSNAITAGSVSDLRRFVNDSGANFELMLTGSASSGSYKSLGNFQNYVAVDTWLQQITNNSNSLNSNVVKVRGTVDVYLTSISYPMPVTFIGEGGTLRFSGGTTILDSSGIRFKDINILISQDFSFNNSVYFDNVNLTDTSVNPLVFDDLTVTNSIILSQNNKTSFYYLKAFNTIITTQIINFISNCNIDSCTISATKQTGTDYNIINSGLIKNSILTISNRINLTSDNISLSNNNITFNDASYFNFSIGTNNINISDNVINYYNSGTASGICNSDSGCLYWSFPNAYESTNINLCNNKFVVNKIGHFPLINFRFTYDGVTTDPYGISNVKINGNTFTNTAADLTAIGVNSDKQAVIAITSGVASSVTTSTSTSATLKSVEIDNNYCVGNQLILIAQPAVKIGIIGDFNSFLNPGLVADGVKITNNTCGAIGYWVTSNRVSSVLPKNGVLEISNNNCHYITNMTDEGKYLPIYELTQFRSFMSSGFVTLSNNKANWLHVGVTSKRSIQDSGYNTYDANLNILNNTILAYNPTYLGDYGSEVNVSSNIGLLVHSNEHSLFNTGATGGTGDDNIVTIDGNTTLADNNHYFYKSCAEIYSSAKITNNTFKGIKNNGSPTIILNLYGYQSIVTNNMLCRKGDITNNTGIINIDYYIKYSGASDFTQYFNPNGIIRNNNFDLSYPGTDATDTKIVDVPANFIYTDNINQTCLTHVPLFEEHYIYQSINSISSNIIHSVNNGDVRWYLTRISDNNNKYLMAVNDSSTGSHPFSFGKQLNLENILPKRVRINYIKLNLYSYTTDIPSAGSVYIKLKKSKTSANIMDLITEASSGDYGNDNSIASPSDSILLNTLSNTVASTLTVTPDSSTYPYNFTQNEDYELFVDFIVDSFTQTSPSTINKILFTPLEISYTWL